MHQQREVEPMTTDDYKALQSPFTLLQETYIPAVERRIWEEKGKWEQTKILIRADTFDGLASAASGLEMPIARLVRKRTLSWWPIVYPIVERRIGRLHGVPLGPANEKELSDAEHDVVETILRQRMLAHSELRLNGSAPVKFNVLIPPKPRFVIEMASKNFNFRTNEMIARLLDVSEELFKKG